LRLGFITSPTEYVSHMPSAEGIKNPISEKNFFKIDRGGSKKNQ
jgi:hypothetical protein